MNIFCYNVRSLRKRFNELSVYFKSQAGSYNIIVLTEVWIKSGEEDMYQLPGYDMLLQPRPDNQAGGVVVYIDSALRYSHCLILLQTAEIINVTFQATCNGFPFDVSLFGVYRQCKFSYNTFKTEFENSVLKLSKNPTIIVGDANLCILKNSGSGKDYLCLMASYGFESYVNEPTRVFNGSSSCLDHVMIRNSRNLNFKCEVLKIGFTDHFAVQISIEHLKFREKNKETFYRVLDKNMLSRQLNIANWNQLQNVKDVNACVSQFYDIYNQCYVASCVLKKLNSRTRKRNDWINDNLINLINYKNRVFKAYSMDRNNLILKNNYKNTSKMVAKRIKHAKVNYYSNLIERGNGDSKAYWNVVRKIVKKKKHSLSKINVNGELVDVEGNEFEVANSFNNYFSNIVPSLRYDAFGCDMFYEDQTLHDVFLSSFRCTEDIIYNALKSMKNKASHGTDGINIITIKENSRVFIPILYNIFKKSLEQSVVPDAFKVAVVVPIFKAGDPFDLSSYRPISLINSFAKIFETIIKNQLIQYFEDSSFFSSDQFGFLPGRGTDLALEKHISTIASEKEEGKFTLSIYLDFKKAFDFLDINILINKLRASGIGNSALNWLVSFCANRTQAVKVNNVLSNVVKLRYGTPQGGVLGPLMFLVYINDLLQVNFYSKIFAYADDTALVCAAYNRELLKQRLQNDLDKISNWLIKNKLLVNTSKSNCIVFFDQNKSKEYMRNKFNFTCHSHMCIYNCSCESIEIVEHTKYLGLFLDENLKWNHQVNNLAKKLKNINYGLFHMKNNVKSEFMKQVYVAWFESTLRYGIIHFGGTYPTILAPIVMAQRHAVRIIYNLRRMDRVSHIFRNHNILTVNQIYQYSIIMYVHKYLQYFNIRQVNRITRNSHFLKLEVPVFNTEHCRNQLCYSGLKVFNKFIEYYGNEIHVDKKPKVKMKAIEFSSTVE